MPKPRFHRAASGLIFLHFTPAPYQRIKVSTGQRCPEKLWNKKTGRATGSGKFQGNAALNALLSRIEDAINVLDRNTRAEHKRPPSAAEVRQAVHIATGRASAKDAGPGLGAFILEEARRRVARKEISAGRERQYIALAGHLEAFGAAYYPATFQNLNGQWYSDFLAYSFDIKKHSQSTVYKHVAILKTCLTAAVQAGLAPASVRERFGEVVRGLREEPPTLTYLTAEEIEQIRALDLPGDDRLARIRDWAIAGAFTGVRFSDRYKISMDKVTATAEGDVLRFMADKTGVVVTIPLHPYVLEVLERNGGQLPRISNQKSNEYLKELCKAAGIRARVTIIRNRAGERVARVVEKWEAVTNHTLRATAASMLYRLGVPVQTIMKFGGWKDRKIFERYIRLTDEEHAGQVGRAWKRAGYG